MPNSPAGERLKFWRASQKLTQAELASFLGRSQSFIGDIESGRAGVSSNLLERLSERTNVNSAWILTGEGSMERDAPAPLPATKPSDANDLALIPRFEIDVSTGPGVVPSEDATGVGLGLSRAWLRRNQIAHDLAVLVTVRGDSMAPTIPDGALVLLHAAEKGVRSEGIYVFSRDDQSFIKRLVPLDMRRDGHASRLLIVSDNGAFASEIISGDQMNSLRIIGRVRACFRSF